MFDFLLIIGGVSLFLLGCSFPAGVLSIAEMLKEKIMLKKERDSFKRRYFL